MKIFIRLLFISMLIGVVVSEFFVTYTLLIDLIQNACLIVFTALGIYSFTNKESQTRDVLNADNLEKELLDQENKQLKQKIQTLESALNKLT